MNIQFRKENKFFRYNLAFFIPICIGGILFYLKHITPFGNESVLCMDLWGQYFPMYAQYTNADSLSELFYSWNGALGYNTLAQNSYYCNSLFLLLFRFVRPQGWIYLLDCICLLKLGLCSVACLSFLEYKTKRVSFYLIAGSVAYSLCSYMLAYMSQPMWTDALIYTPVILLGLERLIQEKKILLYIFFLALCIYSNFYIGFEVCIFVFLYFLADRIIFILKSNRKKTENRINIDWKSFIQTIIYFCCSSLLAGTLTAVVLLPTVMALRLTIASDSTIPSRLEFYDSFLTYLKMMLPSQELNLGYNGANISSGLFCILFLPLYFFNKKIDIRERIVNVVFLIFLIFSLNCNILDYIWHGFHVPHQLPGRWTFLFSLFVIMLSSTGVTNSDDLSLPRISIGLIMIIILISLVNQYGTGNNMNIIYYLFMILGSICLLLPKCNISFIPLKKQRLKNLLVLALCLLWVIDTGTSFIQVSLYEKNGMHTSDGKSYTTNMTKNITWGKKVSLSENEFYRTETTKRFTFNPSMFGDSNGINYYSSTLQGSVYQMLKYMGNPVYASDLSTVYNLSSPVQNSIWGIRYILDYDHSLKKQLPSATLVSDDEDCAIWENEQALPIAFAVSEDVENWAITEDVHSIRNQEDLLDMMCGYKANVFQPIECTTYEYKNVHLDDDTDNWINGHYHRDDDSQPVEFHYTYTCTQEGSVYLEHNYRAGTITVSYNDTTTNISIDNEKGKYLGEFKIGDVITIDVIVENINIGCYGLNLYYFNQDSWLQAYEKLSHNGLDLKTFSNTSLSGIITLDEPGLIFTSIPDDGGWTVYLDDKKTDITLLGNTLIGIKADAGTHVLRLQYSVPGMKVGAIISIMSLFILLGWILVPAIRSGSLAASYNSGIKRIKLYIQNYVHRKAKKKKSVMTSIKLFEYVIRFVILLLLFLSLSINWIHSLYGNIGLEEIIFVMKMPLKGASSDLVLDFCIRVVLISIVLWSVMCLLLNKLLEHFSTKQTVRYIICGCSVLWLVGLILITDCFFSLKTYIISQTQQSQFIAEEYVNPNDVEITFPEEKRNLICIFIESCETTNQDYENGGLFDTNYIPELTQIAKDNISFSQSNLIEGAAPAPGCTWTVAGLLAETSGLPYKLPGGDNNTMYKYEYFLPGMVSLGDILEDEGYYNCFFAGSDFTFGARRNYFTQHGNYEIFDYNWAKREGVIPEDYKVWWGYEDAKLFEYAKEKILELSESDTLFNVSLLTVDTHQPSGYVCDFCEDKYPKQYANVWSCASSQINEFIEWAKQQDFYDNTTIYLCGDHCSMSTSFYSSDTDDEYLGQAKRKVYNAFVNSCIEPEQEKNRVFTTMDMFPSILASIGCNIDGERLGLGTNLFSNENTLAEKYGLETLYAELNKKSVFYDSEILYPKN